jgi:two-component system sensor histidine kinase KdpD
LTILDAQDCPITVTVFLSLLGTETNDLTAPPREQALILREVSEEQAVGRLRSEFLTHIAHEFRTPLSTISASAELLMDEGREMTSDEFTNMVNAIRLSGVHLQTIVDNLLESAIIEAGVFRLRYRPLRSQDIVDNVVVMMTPLLQRRQQRLEVDASEDISDFWGDPNRINQAIVNLVENASKYSPIGTNITLSIQREEDLLIFAVLDFGPGLPNERPGDLFNRFVTGSHPRSAQFGIGMGLPIVKAIAEAHGGRAGADNRPGGGAVVWFTLPHRQPGEQGDEL